MRKGTFLVSSWGITDQSKHHQKGYTRDGTRKSLMSQKIPVAGREQNQARQAFTNGRAESVPTLWFKEGRQFHNLESWNFTGSRALLVEIPRNSSVPNRAYIHHFGWSGTNLWSWTWRGPWSKNDYYTAISNWWLHYQSYRDLFFTTVPEHVFH